MCALQLQASWGKQQILIDCLHVAHIIIGGCTNVINKSNRICPQNIRLDGRALFPLNTVQLFEDIRCTRKCSASSFFHVHNKSPKKKKMNAVLVVNLSAVGSRSGKCLRQFQLRSRIYIRDVWSNIL